MSKEKRIEIEWNGPYHVDGEIPLVRKTQIVSEYGEPIAWQTEETLKPAGHYELCRCGHSKDKPFCDSSHLDFDFDGTETASTEPDAQNRVRLPGGKKIIVRQNGFAVRRIGLLRAAQHQHCQTAGRYRAIPRCACR